MLAGAGHLNGCPSTDVPPGVHRGGTPAHDAPMIARLVPRAPVAARIDMPAHALSQAGCFTRSQARAAGFGDYSQRALVRSGRWLCVVGSVMACAGQPRDAWSRAHAAVLASGRYRAVSHSTAAAIWGWPIDEDLHVIRPGGRLHSGITEHRHPLAAGEVALQHGVRLTTLARTVEDVITGFESRAAAAALAEGFRLGLFMPEDVQAAAHRAHGRTGAPRARSLAASCRGRPFSILEWDFHQVAWTVDPGGWGFNVPVRDRHGLIGHVDALHEPTGTVVELDGRAFHEDRFQADRTRDQRLACLGLLCVRLTHADVAAPLMVAARLRSILDRRATSQAAPASLTHPWIGPRSGRASTREGARSARG